MAAIYCSNLLGAQAFIRVGELNFVLARNQQGANLQVGGRLRRRTSAMAFCPCLQKSRRSAQITASLSALREPRGRPGGLPEPVPPNVMVGVPRWKLIELFSFVQVPVAFQLIVERPIQRFALVGNRRGIGQDFQNVRFGTLEYLMRWRRHRPSLASAHD